MMMSMTTKLKIRARRLYSEFILYALLLPPFSCGHFLQDSAPCHKAEVGNKWFQERSHIINLVKWLGYIPDLNQ